MEGPFWQTDCGEMLDQITLDARKLLEEAGAPIDDETLFIMFQIVTLNFALAAAGQPKMRQFLGIA